MQLYPPLLVGARLILASPKGHLDPPYIVELLLQHEVNKFIISVPTMVRNNPFAFLLNSFYMTDL
jgi:non-ribosomal peptide synthetase component F